MPQAQPEGMVARAEAESLVTILLSHHSRP